MLEILEFYEVINLFGSIGYFEVFYFCFEMKIKNELNE